MPLQSGTRIGGYEIIALLGAGGMGEVYRARDTRLGRDVAIKVLSPRIAADREAVVRFEREARALATLNHPNVAAIHDVVETTHGQPALILELVDGLTLADRLAQRPLAVDEAIVAAKQIADALDAAHEAGIVHRDLKPGNIKITDEGQIKVLDFGLATAVAAAAGAFSDADPDNSPTITVHRTQPGVILGTAAYMSPEQARGKRVDKRTDIWAFGCVLFEMLTQRPVFTGETTSDVIAAIIERAPDLSGLPTATPAHVRRIIERCLEKDPSRRARDIADIRVELDSAPEPVRAATASSSLGRGTGFGLAVLVLALAGVAAWTWRRPAPTPPSVVEFTFAAPPEHTLILVPPVPSPDGRMVAFIARDPKQVTSIWVRSLDSAEVRRLDDTAGASVFLAWSSDSRSLVFFVDPAWRRISVDGGPAVTIVASGGTNLGVSWGSDDTLLLAPANRTALSRVPISGGPLQQVTALDSTKENSHRWPQLLPDSRHFLFTVRSDSRERLGIKLGALDNRENRMLVNVASSGVYTEPGWLLFTTPDQVLMAQRLDSSDWTLRGAAQPVAGQVRYNGPSFSGLFGASLDGRVLTYLPAARAGATLEWFDRAGTSLGRLGPERPYRGMRLSPDGRRVAVELADEHLGTRDLWLLDTTAQALTRLTSHGATDWRAVFSPDGTSLVFASDRAGASTVFRTAVNGAGGEAVVYRHASGGVFPWDWSRDGKQIVAAIDDENGRPSALALIPADGGPSVTVIDIQPDGVVNPRLSPEGDRVAFMSRASGGTEVYILSIRDRQRVRISTDGGSNPVWGGDGRELFYANARNEMMRAEVDGVTLQGSPTVLFRPCAAVNRTFNVAADVAYDVTRDGQRFLVTCGPADSVPSAVTVVLNWQNKVR